MCIELVASLVCLQGPDMNCHHGMIYGRKLFVVYSKLKDHSGAQQHVFLWLIKCVAFIAYLQGCTKNVVIKLTMIANCAKCFQLILIFIWFLIYINSVDHEILYTLLYMEQ